MPTTVHYYCPLLLSTAVHQSTTVHYYCTVVHHCPPLITDQHCPQLLSTTDVHHCPLLLSTIAHYFPPLPTTVVHYRPSLPTTEASLGYRVRSCFKDKRKAVGYWGRGTRAHVVLHICWASLQTWINLWNPPHKVNRKPQTESCPLTFPSVDTWQPLWKYNNKFKSQLKLDERKLLTGVELIVFLINKTDRIFKRMRCMWVKSKTSKTAAYFWPFYNLTKVYDLHFSNINGSLPFKREKYTYDFSRTSISKQNKCSESKGLIHEQMSDCLIFPLKLLSSFSINFISGVNFYLIQISDGSWAW